MSMPNGESNAAGQPSIGNYGKLAFSPWERGWILLAVVVSVALLALVHPWTRIPPAPPRGISEGIAGVGSIRTAMRVYAKAHNGAFPVLKSATGNELSVIGIQRSDLEGKYFRAIDYLVNSSADAYTICATHPATGETYIINQAGVELGTFKTGP